tara:strand:- start:164 stop:484 length:321 start_codon:yes stop_codon:yes gene_type:complete
MIENNINTFIENLGLATKKVHVNTTRPYCYEICTDVISKYHNLQELYITLDSIFDDKNIKPLVKLFAMLCFHIIHLSVSLKTHDDKLKEKSVKKINFIQEYISNYV